MTPYQKHCAAVVENLVERLNVNPDGSWTAPWHTNSQMWMPSNFTTKQPYNGGNIVSLALAAMDHDYTSTEWATYRQWAGIECQVRKGEKATRIVRWVTVGKDKSDPEARGRLVPKVFSVFNLDQVELSEAVADSLTTAEPINPDERNAHLDAWVTATGATITTGAATPHFNPAHDRIGMPEFASFNTAGDYYATVIHELVHWTSAKRRCDREILTSARNYAMEELVAELGAAMLCPRLGVTPSPRADHADYLAHWVSALKEAPAILFKQASLAHKATAYLLDTAGQPAMLEAA